MSLLYGFDSSLTHFGYAVARRTAEGLAFVSVGCFATRPDAERESKTADTRRRVEGLARELRGLVQRHGAPAVICVEALALPLGRTSLVTVSALGRARGLVDALIIEHGAVAAEFQPQALKAAVTGSRSATKLEVQQQLEAAHPELERLFAGLRASSVEHAADAAAAVHAFTTQHQPEES